MVSLDLTAKLNDAELAELLELRDGVGKVWIGVGIGVGEAAAKVAEIEAAVVWGEEVDEGAPRLDLHGDGVPAPRAVAANGAGEEELLPRPPYLLVLSLTLFLFFFSVLVLVLIDRLLILSCDHAAYCGDPRRLANFLAAFGCPVPAGESPAEFALDAVRSLTPARHRRSSSSTSPLLRDAIAASISQGKLVSSWGC
uniref:Uncharacterized protein n=1 Tax=Ananas comosus var. bracteatus TaxID=296719 RepID=A0A6V7Q016_ANACO|nr:unnamed protein product [Ananas comosus var. bracteatus]